MHLPTNRNRIAAFPPLASDPALPLVIDAVAPGSRGGVAPVKRVVDEPLRVEADVMAERESVRVSLRWRVHGALRWEEMPMEPLGDFRYGAELRIPVAGDYEFAVRAGLWAGPGEAMSAVESLVVERALGRAAAWVAMTLPGKGTGRALREALPGLDALKRMGFDLAILPPLGGSAGEIDPGSGGAEDFDWLLRAAAQRGLELAVTLPVGDASALGYGADHAARWDAWAARARRWVARGVRALACPDAHLAPVAFWRRLLAELRADFPACVFLAGADGGPKQRLALARAGFSQSLATVGATGSLVEWKRRVRDLHAPAAADHFRHCLWPEFSGTGGDPARMRPAIALAALLAPAWGISEHWLAGRAGLIAFVAQLNHLRRTNPALREAGPVLVCHSSEPGVLALLRKDGRNAVLVVLNRAPRRASREVSIHLPRVLESETLVAVDLLTGVAEPWDGRAHRIGLDGGERGVRVFRIEIEGERARSVLS